MAQVPMSGLKAQVSVSDGTAGAPSISFSNDTNTGLYRPASDSVSVVTGGVERMRVDAAGNVGIGTTNPQAALHVQGTATITGYLNGIGNGIHPSHQIYILNSDFTGQNSGAAQPLFGVGVTLSGNTFYMFESLIGLYKTSGSASHSIYLAFAGTATTNNINYYYTYSTSTVSFTYNTIVPYTTGYCSTTGNLLLNTWGGATQGYNVILLKGTVSINGGGTFIPQYVLINPPGATYKTAAGSYFSIWPVANAGANVQIGTWG